MPFVTIMKGIHNRPEAEGLSPTCPFTVTPFVHLLQLFLGILSVHWYQQTKISHGVFSTFITVVCLPHLVNILFLLYFPQKHHFLKGARCFFTLKSHLRCHQTVAPDDLQFSIIFLKPCSRQCWEGRWSTSGFFKNQCQNNSISPWR